MTSFIMTSFIMTSFFTTSFFMTHLITSFLSTSSSAELTRIGSKSCQWNSTHVHSPVVIAIHTDVHRMLVLANESYLLQYSSQTQLSPDLTTLTVAPQSTDEILNTCCEWGVRCVSCMYRLIICSTSSITSPFVLKYCTYFGDYVIVNHGINNSQRYSTTAPSNVKPS